MLYQKAPQRWTQYQNVAEMAQPKEATCLRCLTDLSWSAIAGPPNRERLSAGCSCTPARLLRACARLGRPAEAMTLSYHKARSRACARCSAAYSLCGLGSTGYLLLWLECVYDPACRAEQIGSACCAHLCRDCEAGVILCDLECLNTM